MASKICIPGQRTDRTKIVEVSSPRNVHANLRRLLFSVIDFKPLFQGKNDDKSPGKDSASKNNRTDS